MKVTFDSKGDFENAIAWLDKLSKTEPLSAMQQIGADGVTKLSAGTPKDTGETAQGWQAVIDTKGKMPEVSWINTAHPDLNVNLAILIEQGHGTRNGGYVLPKPYIKQSMESVWKQSGDILAKEMIK